MDGQSSAGRALPRKSLQHLVTSSWLTARGERSPNPQTRVKLGRTQHILPESQGGNFLQSLPLANHSFLTWNNFSEYSIQSRNPDLQPGLSLKTCSQYQGEESASEHKQATFISPQRNHIISLHASETEGLSSPKEVIAKQAWAPAKLSLEIKSSTEASQTPLQAMPVPFSI